MQNYLSDMKAKITLLILFYLVITTKSLAQTYYSRQSGNWNDNNTWSTVSHTGPAAITPPLAATDVIIGNGHVVTSTLVTDLLLNQNITVAVGSALNLQNGNTNLVSSFTINGTLRLEGGNLNGTAINFNNGSTYIHARDGGVIPTATWGATSECRITGVTNLAITNGFAQTFGNFVWNCPLQTTIQSITGNMTVQGTFDLFSTGSNAFNLANANFTVNGSCTISGNLLDNIDSGTNVFNNDITVTNTGTWNTVAVTSNGANMRITGNITHNNNTINSFRAGIMRFVAGTNLNGTATSAIIIIDFIEATSGGSPLTNNHKLEVTRMDLFGIRQFIQGTGSTLRFRNASILNRTDETNTNFHSNPNTVEYIGGSGDVFADEYHNLIVNTTDTKTLTGNIAINGSFTLAQGIFQAITYNINLRGDWVNNSNLDDFEGGDGTVFFDGASSQMIAGSVGTRFANISIDNNVTLARSIEVSNQLIFAPSNYLTLNAHNLTMLQNGTGSGDILGGSATSYVVTNGAGRVRFRNISAGTLNDHYIFAPLGYNNTNKYAALNLPVNNFAPTQEIIVWATQPGNAPAPAITAANRVDAVWEVTLPAGCSPNTTLDANFFYNGNVIGSLVSGNGRAYQHNGTNWVVETHVSSNNTETTFLQSNFSGSRYYGVFIESLTYTTLGNAAWNVNGNWSTDGGVTDCGCNPAGQSGSIVNINHHVDVFGVGDIGANNTINLATAGSRLNLHVLPTNTITELNGVSGSNLVMLVNGLPNVTTNNFITTPNTTVQFVAIAAGAVPDNFSGQNYQNLAFMNGAKTMTLSTNRSVLGFIDIYDNLTIAASATATLTATNDITLHNAANLTITSPAKLLVQENMITIPTYTGSVTSTIASLEFDNLATAKYIHSHNGGSVPAATWQPLSECRITGMTNIMPTGFAGQSFGNLTWDCVNQQTYAAFNANFNIQGTLRIENTRDGATPLGLAVSDNGNFTVTTQNFIMNNPTPNSAVFYPYGGSNAADVGTLEVTGNLTIANQATGVLSGIGTSRLRFTGANNATFSYNASFTFYTDAIWEVEVAKSPGASLSFTSPINFIGFDPASGTPTSILRITSGEAIFLDNLNLSVGVIAGNGTLSLLDNSALYLRNQNISFDNTFAGILNASTNNARVFYDAPITQTIFRPSTGAYHSLILLNAGNKNLGGAITLTGNWTNNATGAFNAGTNTVTFAGATPQVIEGTATTEFNNLNISNDVTLAPSTNVRFRGQLFIANDKYLSLGDGNLIAVYGVSTIPSFNAGTNKYVVTDGSGSIKIRNENGSSLSASLLVPMGHTSPMQYAGIVFPFNNLPNNQEISLQVKLPGTSPYPAIANASRVNAVWQVILPNITTPNTGTPVELYYLGSTVGGFTGGLAHYHNGTAWISETTNSSNISSTFFEPVSFTNATRYYAVFAGPTDYYTLANDAIWNVNSNLWSNDGTTPCNCSPNGVAGANVRIRHNAFIPTGADVATGTIINIENPVTLTADFAFTAAQLLGVSGARLSVTNGLPAITTNTFATTAGTIVEFAGGAGTIPNQFGTANYRNLVIAGTGTKTLGANTTVQENLTIIAGTLEPAGFDLLVTGTTTIFSGAAFLDATTGGINEFRTLINNGSFGASGTGANNSSFNFLGDITNNAGATFNIDCNCTYSFNKVSPPLIISPNNPMVFGSAGGGQGNFLANTTIADGQAVTFNVTNAANLLISAGIIVTNNNTVGVQINGNGTLQGANATSTWLQGINAVLGYASDQVPMSVGILDANSNENIVNYNRTGNQQLKATAYQTLLLTNSSIKAVPSGSGNIIIDNSFIVPNGITFRVSDGNFTSNNITTINGVWEDALGGGTSTFHTLNIGASGSMIVVGTNTSFFIFLGNITNQGVFNLRDSSQWRLNADLTIQNQSASPMNFAQPNSGTGQVNGNVTILDFAGGDNVAFHTNIASPISGGGTIINQLGDNGTATGRRLILEICQVPITNAANAVTEYRGNTDIASKTLTALNNTFVYTSGLTVAAGSTFHRVIFTNNQTYNLGGNINANVDLFVIAGSPLNAGANKINIRGNWTSNGTFNGGTGSVIFDGTALQTITSSATSPFNNINISNTAHIAMNNNVRSGSITFTQGRLQTGNFDFTLTAIPATNQIVQSFTAASTSYVEVTATGRLIRENILGGNLTVFPIGDATAIRHIGVTPATNVNISASFDNNLVIPAPGGSTDVAAGRWLLSGASGVLNFYNTGSTTATARVHRLNAGVWDNTGITTTGPGPTYTTNSLNFNAGEIYTLFSTAPVTINVLPNTPTLASGEVGVLYTQTFAATGGIAPYTFAVTAGTLPDGLTLNPTTGVLTGLPTVAGVFSFTITASDANLPVSMGSQAYTLTIGRGSQSVIRASATYTPLGNNRFELSAITTQGLPTKFFSTNTEVARIENGNILVVVRNVGEADIMAYQEGNANIAPSDTIMVMRVSNFSLVTAFGGDLEQAFSLYPNPATDKVSLQTTIEVKQIEIYNSLGQIQSVAWYNKGNEIEIEMKNLAQGVYTIRIHTPLGVVIKRVSKL